MFGNKKYKEAKRKVFSDDKKRKQFFAIQNYYKQKTKETDRNNKIGHTVTPSRQKKK